MTTTKKPVFTKSGVDCSAITEHVNERVAAAVKDVLERIEVSYLTTIPANRKKTHRHLGVRIGKSGRQGRAGIFFPARTRFDPEHTETKRLAKAAWLRVGHECEQILTRAVSQAIETAPTCFRIVIGE